LSDEFGRKPLLLISFIIFFISYTGFAFSLHIFLIGMLFVFYGLFQGIFRSVGKSYAADFVPPHLRASGVGWYSMIVGLSGLIASVVAGNYGIKLVMLLFLFTVRFYRSQVLSHYWFSFQINNMHEVNK